MRTATSRTSERFELHPPIEGRLGPVQVSVCDLSPRGARIIHSDVLPAEAGRLRFVLDEHQVDLPVSLLWTSSNGDGEEMSGILFDDHAGGTVGKVLEVLQTTGRSQRIEELREGERFVLRDPLSGTFRSAEAGETLEAEINDLSIHGARVTLATPVKPGSLATLAFPLSSSGTPGEAQVRVVWCQPAEGGFDAGLSADRREESLRQAIADFCQSDSAMIQPRSVDVRLRLLRARAERMARFHREISEGGVSIADILLVRSVDTDLRMAPEEALYWNQKAAESGNLPGELSESPHLLAVWQFLGRSIDPSVVARAVSIAAPALAGETLSEARDEILRLRTLVEAGKLINSSIEAEALFQSILAVARGELEVERGTLYFVDESSHEIWSKIASGLGSTEIRLPIGKGLAGTVAATGETIILNDAYSDPRFDRSSDARSGFHTRSMLSVPIRNRQERVVGVLQLLNKRNGEFGAKDVEFLESLSDHMAIAMENATLHLAEMAKDRMERELQLGREIQSSLLRKPPSDVAHTELAADSRACYEVGGDYYDFIELPDGDLGVAIGDVSGKGVSAALIMSSLQASLRMAAPIESDLPRLVARLNGLLYRMTLGRKYVTFFFARYNPASGKLYYVNAGHNPPILCSGSTVRRLESTGKPIGLLPDVEYREGTAELAPGDVLFLYTDGMIEASDPEDEEFGMDRWSELLRRSSSHQTAALPQLLFDSISRFERGAPVTDDKTIVVIRRAHG